MVPIGRRCGERRIRRAEVLAGFVAATALALFVAGAAALGGFDDDDGDVHEPAIDALAGRGILEGTECGAGVICPRDPFERWVMAVWLVRALGETPSPAPIRFVDVDPEVWWAPYVERLAELDVTLGCATGPARYCPGDPVGRGQMATFLARAFGLEPGPPSGFGDTAGHTHAPGIDTLAAAGITAGCATDPARYCPSDPVTRGQMATFLARVLGLVPLPAAPEAGAPSPFTKVATHEFFSCGLRADGTVDCWGWNFQGSAPALDGRFTDIAFGDLRVCGLRVDGTIDCWRLPDDTDEPPEGRFSSMDSGGSHLCGLRTDGTIECWGRDWYGGTEIPEGRFRSVTVAEHHACGLRVDGTVSCWGGNEHGKADPPAGRFTAVEGAWDYTCGLRVDGTVDCWGSLLTGPPEGRFDTLVVGRFQICGTRPDRTVACWGTTRGVPPNEELTVLSIDYSQSCGIRTDGTLACWGDRDEEWVDPPEGRFTAVDTGQRSCGVRDDGSIECWGLNPWWPWRAQPPDGRFAAVDTGGFGFSCALGVDGAVACWGGLYAAGGKVPPAGRFTAVATGRFADQYVDSPWDYPTSCAIRADDLTVDCWGSYVAGSPGGRFTAIDGGLSGRYCGIRTDGAVTCWGWDGTARTDVPEGRFSAVAVGRSMSCGIRVGGAVDCWGEDAESGTSEAPPGRFAAISSFDSGPTDDRWAWPPGSGIEPYKSSFCGVRTAGTVTCWGANQHAAGGRPCGALRGGGHGRGPRLCVEGGRRRRLLGKRRARPVHPSGRDVQRAERR